MLVSTYIQFCVLFYSHCHILLWVSSINKENNIFCYILQLSFSQAGVWCFYVKHDIKCNQLKLCCPVGGDLKNVCTNGGCLDTRCYSFFALTFERMLNNFQLFNLPLYRPTCYIAMHFILGIVRNSLSVDANCPWFSFGGGGEVGEGMVNGETSPRSIGNNMVLILVYTLWSTTVTNGHGCIIHL